MTNRTSVAALFVLLAAACAGPESSRRPAVLQDVPILAGSNVVDSVGTDETLQVRFLVGMHRDSVAAFYRRVLPQRGWRIVGDVREGEAMQIYAERDGPPLWIQIRSAGVGVAQYTLIGAQAPPDSAAAPAR